MKKILVLLMVFLLAGCTKWEELELINGERTIVLLNVEITFRYKVKTDTLTTDIGTIDTLYYAEQEIEVLNKNHGGAEVRVSRRVKDCWSDYTEIFYSWIGGGQSVCEHVYFERKDKIEVRIKVDNWTDEDPVRYTYFKLKSASVTDTSLVLADTTIVL